MLTTSNQVGQHTTRRRAYKSYSVFFLTEEDAAKAAELIYGSLYSRVNETDNWIVTFPWFVTETEKKLYDEDEALRVCSENHAFKVKRFW